MKNLSFYFRCDEKNSCTMPVNSAIFGGDPCPGTHKYVEVHYACMAKHEQATTKRPQMPRWYLEANAGELWNNAGSNNNVPKAQIPNTNNKVSTTTVKTTPKRKPILVTRPTTPKPASTTTSTTSVRIPITTPTTKSITAKPAKPTTIASYVEDGVKYEKNMDNAKGMSMSCESHLIN